MPAHTDPWSLAAAGACVAGGLLAGLLLRLIAAWLARRATEGVAIGWRLVRALALPAAVAAGFWGAAEVLQPEPPVRGILDRVLLVLVVVVAAVAVANLVAAVIRSVMAARSVAGQSSIFVNVARLLVLVVGVLVALHSLGISITPMLTALGVGGLAVALALQDTLANVFAGIQLLAGKKLLPGDFIRLDSGEDGYVVDVTWRNTTIRRVTGNLVVVPNSTLASAIVTNFHQPRLDLAIWFEVGVSYASDLAEVERVTVEVARDVMATVEGGVPDFAPLLRFHTFGDSSINFTVIMRATEFVAQYLVVHEFIKRLHARYRREGIEIPFPIRTLVSGDRPRSAASGEADLVLGGGLGDVGSVLGVRQADPVD